jgi:site-specific recombinase XerD
MSYTITPMLQEQKINAQGKCPIAIRVIINRQTTYRSTGHRINPDHWDPALKKVTSKASNHSLINADIKNQIADLERALLEKKILKTPLTREVVQKVLKDEDDDFLIYADTYIQLMYQMQKRSSVNAKKADIEKLKQFHHNKRLMFNEITQNYLERFEIWMMADKIGTAGEVEKGNEANTVWKTMKTLRAVFNRAVKVDKITKHYPFSDYKLSYRDPLREHHELEEVELMWKAAYDGKFSAPLTLILKYYLLGCYTGLRFSDLRRVHDGTVIRKHKVYMLDHKTGGIVSVPMNSRAVQLAQEIGKQRLCSYKNASRFIKDIAKKLEIEREVSWHVARHTFAVIWLELGGSLEELQRFMGHASIKTTAIYGKITNKKLEQSMSRWERAFE